MKSTKTASIKTLLRLENIFRWLLIINFFIMAYCWFYKDILPEKSFYISSMLKDPIQIKSNKVPFYIHSNKQKYLITPQFDYELEGVIVTYNNADQFGNIWHTKRWKDFINVRDLCVIWGNNVKTGSYRKISFSSDSWTCWATTKKQKDWQMFSMLQLSNNHLLVDNKTIKSTLMSTEKGDQIRFKGMLVNYKNEGSSYQRGTSIRRDDTGNGACETVYLTSFEIIKKANKNLRKFYQLSKYIFIFSLCCFFLLMCFTPKRKNTIRL